MGWDFGAFTRIVTSDKDLVGAAYPCKNRWDFYGCALEEGPDGGAIKDEKGDLKAWTVPAGFCKIKKAVFLRLIEAYPDNYYTETDAGGAERKIYNFYGKLGCNDVKEIQHRFWGEDTSLCLKWRKIGGEAWIVPDCHISHAGIKMNAGNFKEHIERGSGRLQEMNHGMTAFSFKAGAN